MSAFETLGGGGKGGLLQLHAVECLLYRCVVILMPPVSGVSHLHSPVRPEKQMKETPRKQSILLKLKLKQ